MFDMDYQPLTEHEIIDILLLVKAWMKTSVVSRCPCCGQQEPHPYRLLASDPAYAQFIVQHHVVNIIIRSPAFRAALQH